MTIIVEKVWGHEEWLENNDLYCVKLLYVRQGFRCSLHYHPIKDETFFLKSGRILLEYGVPLAAVEMVEGSHVRLLPGTTHRFTGLEDSVIVEAGTPHDDRDVVRLTQSGKL